MILLHTKHAKKHAYREDARYRFKSQLCVIHQIQMVPGMYFMYRLPVFDCFLS